jgi:hypothetical protein
VKNALIVVAAALGFGSGVAAQWPDAVTPGLPRLPDGRPDLSAPAPRLPDGRPDLSGIWVLETNTDPGFLGLPFGPEFGNIGASLPEGLPYRPWARAQVAATRANDRSHDPLSHCLPIGPVRMHTITFYRQVVQLRDKIIFLSEYNSTYRQIFIDRPLPDDPVPTLSGYSSARWVGDTLEVTTRGLRDGAIWADSFGSPLTDAARVTERLRRVSVGELRIELTVDDPKAYTEPWTVTLVQRLAPDLELAEATCAEEQLGTLVSAAQE